MCAYFTETLLARKRPDSGHNSGASWRVLEDVDVKVEILGIVNEFIDGHDGVLRPIMLPVELLEVGLKFPPILTLVPLKSPWFFPLKFCGCICEIAP